MKSAFVILSSGTFAGLVRPAVTVRCARSASVVSRLMLQEC
jgi:hypothetical protein